jgi:hypothetical protein
MKRPCIVYRKCATNLHQVGFLIGLGTNYAYVEISKRLVRFDLNDYYIVFTD